MMIAFPSVEAAKARARELRATLAGEGRAVSHAEALELVAKAHGFRDWNTLHAMIGNRPRCPVSLGDLVEGRYLGQAFLAEVVGVSALSEGRWEVELALDQPVDVVTFDSFSNFRSRIRKVIGADGTSAERTSDGQPHLRLSL